MQHWITNVLAGGLAYPKTLPLHRCKGEVFHLKAHSLTRFRAHTYENHRGWFLKAWNDYGISHFLITVNVFNMAAFTTYCRFQSAPDQRIRNVWDNILQFRRLMAQLFIKADRAKDKNTSREQNGPSASRRGTQLWKGSTTAKSSACCCHVLATCQHSRQHQWGYPALSQVQARQNTKEPREHVWK